MFVTWRLHGSLPSSFRLTEDKREKTPGQRFFAADQLLDTATTGPLWLRDPRIAKLIVESLQCGSEKLGQYDLHAFVVMANHVHVLLRPRTEIARITRGIKGATACRANRILGRVGQPFWQEESFDHWLRQFEFERVASYIENNPVKAGLVAAERDWVWSSAHPRYRGIVVDRRWFSSSGTL